ncbi:MAG: hypothetical protein WA789_01245 [Candidatus Acidiferrum sp.]
MLLGIVERNYLSILTRGKAHTEHDEVIVADIDIAVCDLAGTAAHKTVAIINHRHLIVVGMRLESSTLEAGRKN